MIAPTVKVTVSLAAIGGTALAGAVISASLSKPEIYDGVVVSKKVAATTDDEGIAVLDLFPNAMAPAGLGTQGSTYAIYVSVPGGKPLNLRARVPDTDCNLHEILVADSDVPPLDAAEIAVGQAQAAAAIAGQALAGVTVKAGEVESAREEVAQAKGDVAENTGAAVAARLAIDSRIYPGTYVTAPTTRPDESARQAGDRYLSASGVEYIFLAGSWVDYRADAQAAKGQAEVAAGTAATQAGIATTQTAQATAAAAAAALARDASFALGPKYADEATGRAAVANGETFLVVGSGDVAAREYRRTNSSASVLIAEYPSSSAVAKPGWSGKKNAWPDTFFRKFDMSSPVQFGRPRWYTNSGGSNVPSTAFTRVANAVFDGYALRRSGDLGTATLHGPRIYLDDIGAVPGDTITVYGLFVSDGATVSFAGRFANASNALIGSQVGALNEAGGGTLASLGSTPKWLRHQHTIPEGAASFWVYPYSSTAGKHLDLVALWAFKGTDGPAWPSLHDPEGTGVTVAAQGTRLAAAESTLALNTPAVAYAVDSYGVVSASATTVALDGTGFGANARDLVFSGWGERYEPADVSFNAVRIKMISRTPGTTAKWRTLNIVVRTGENSHQAGAAVVAVGSIAVLESADVLTDVTILLRDPVTGAVKTLADDDFTGDEYFVGVYAVKADGTPAACGEPRGTLANSLGQSYYNTSSPVSGGWAATTGGSNVRLAFQHLSLTAPVESVAYQPAQSFAQALAATAAVPVPSTVAPPIIYGVQGRECNVYTRALHYGDHGEYFHDFAGSVGAQQNERWTLTPAGAITSGTLTYSAHDKRTGGQLVSHVMQLRAAAANAGSGATKKLMFVGDSWINGGVITQTLLDIAATDVMGVTLYGTRGSGSNKHEGRGGWTINDYATAGRTYYAFTVSGVTVLPAINSTVYTNNGGTFTVQEVSLSGGAGTIVCSYTGSAPAASGTLTKSSGAGDATIAFSASASVSGNPFWLDGEIDFGQYLTDNSFPELDTVYINLGVNDGFGQTSDVGCAALADTELVKLDTLIASIKASGSGTKVALMLPSPGADQDAFGASYGIGQNSHRYKRNMAIWAAKMIAKYAGQEGSRVFLVPCNVAWDTVANQSFAAAAPVNSRNSAMTVARQNNGVHPATSGYQQIGDACWAFEKYRASV